MNTWFSKFSKPIVCVARSVGRHPVAYASGAAGLGLFGADIARRDRKSKDATAKYLSSYNKWMSDNPHDEPERRPL